MPLGNGDHGYGAVTETLHWLTVFAILGQFLVGWTMEGDDEAFYREKDRIDALEDAGKDRAKEQGDAAEDAFKDEIDRLEDNLDAREDDYVSAAFSDVFSGGLLADGVSLPEIHVLLGLSVVTLGLLRVSWRAAAPLPPWAPYLRPGERRLEAALEKLLLTLLFVVPGTGLLLIATGDDWLAAHIAAQFILLAVIAVHVGLVLSHTVVRRDGQLRRML
ncbi:cytochrome b [Mycobacterium sp. ITM-2016-00318]|uniref:cytochrome b n=1 Tax=Mycobacterium sp. ITM-2016-00318 TaxID=2099693 RepID=UPI000CFA3CCE|nr:cytochrome b/b6 domain-containing protein [Mycobacterium sp. ITM-2016-00318]WNG93488.1 cytochrome b/b6 domain-containing protein [Mycobacterium sp. ITM-2016-00318]